MAELWTTAAMLVLVSLLWGTTNHFISKGASPAALPKRTDGLTRHVQARPEQWPTKLQPFTAHSGKPFRKSDSLRQLF
jgi:hypothetical protein